MTISLRNWVQENSKSNFIQRTARRQEVAASNAVPPINEAIGNLNHFFVNEAPRLSPFDAAKAIYDKLEQLAELKRCYLQKSNIMIFTYHGLNIQIKNTKSYVSVIISDNFKKLKAQVVKNKYINLSFFVPSLNYFGRIRTLTETERHQKHYGHISHILKLFKKTEIQDIIDQILMPAAEEGLKPIGNSYDI